MESLIIEPTPYLPKIVLDKNTGVFEISGRSIPKNPDEFYFPVFDWIDNYLKDPGENTNIIMNVEYMNTASHKCLAIILNKLNVLTESDDHYVKVTWNYEMNDEDMYEMGEELEDCNDLPFEFIAYKI